jgi:hypothetical protein
MTGPQNPKDLPELQSWRRLHRSTYVVLAVLLAILALANVPAQIVIAPSMFDAEMINAVFGMRAELQHGWPATYLWRKPDDLTIDWQSLWTLSEDVERWSRTSLAFDLFVGLAALALGGVGYEAWRRRRARLWQFHLRDLLALLAVASIVLGYWKIHTDEYRSQQKALAALNANADESDWQPGGPSWLRLLLSDGAFQFLDRVVNIRIYTDDPDKLQHLARLRYLKHIDFLSGKNLQYLRYHPQLEALDCSVRGAEGDQWAALRYVPNLKTLNLYETGIADRDLAHLAGLKRLQSLRLLGNRITDQGLIHLAGLTNLKSLSLARTEVTDAGLVYLQGLTNLRELSLSDKVTPAGLEQLAGLTNLEELSLPWTIDGHALWHLRHFRKLRHIEINDPGLTDEQLAPLAEMVGLESLSIDGDWCHGPGQAVSQHLSRLACFILAGDNLRDLGWGEPGELRKLALLWFRSPRITDAGIVHLAPLGNLKSLSLANARITGKGLEQLRTLRSLTALELDGTGTTDADLTLLGDLPPLENLTLQDLPLTDASVSVLVRMPHLTSLTLGNTKVTDAGQLRLKECEQLQICWVNSRFAAFEALFLEQPFYRTNMTWDFSRKP